MTDNMFSAQEITAEYEALGYTYPKKEDFAEWEIKSEAMKLGDHHLTTQVNELSGTKFPPKVLAAYAKLAETLGAGHEVKMTGYSMAIVRPATDDEKLQRAVDTLRSQRYDEQRISARKSLERKMGVDV